MLQIYKYDVVGILIEIHPTLNESIRTPIF